MRIYNVLLNILAHIFDIFKLEYISKDGRNNIKNLVII